MLDHAPDNAVQSFGDFERRVGWIFGMQPGTIRLQEQAFDGEFAVYSADRNAAMRGFDGPIDHQQIAIVNRRALHGIALNTHKERRRRVIDQMFIEIQTLVNVILSGRGKTRGHTTGE